MKLSQVLLGGLLLALSASFHSISFAHPYNNDKVIYGEDNRKDVFESEDNHFIEWAKSTAAMISYQNIVASRQDGKVDIRSKSLQDSGVCAEERFAKQPIAARCSGFLIGEDLLVTAGHCVRTESDCKNFAWVFDFKVDSFGQDNVRVPKESVYGCSKILAHKLDGATMDDYALLQLTKKVEDRSPLEFRKEGSIEKETSLVVIGHPTGLPTKIADGAKVRDNSNPYYFVANLDTYGGNSGSAVFDADSGLVEGILVRGETDYEYVPGKGCRISKRCSDLSCRGEDVTRITNIPELKNL